jgi:hypothetical protein
MCCWLIGRSISGVSFCGVIAAIASIALTLVLGSLLPYEFGLRSRLKGSQPVITLEDALFMTVMRRLCCWGFAALTFVRGSSFRDLRFRFRYRFRLLFFPVYSGFSSAIHRE